MRRKKKRTFIKILFVILGVLGIAGENDTLIVLGDNMPYTLIEGLEKA